MRHEKLNFEIDSSNFKIDHETFESQPYNSSKNLNLV